MTDDQPSQTDKFKEAARTLECDNDDERFKARVTKLVRHKPVEKPERGCRSAILLPNGSRCFWSRFAGNMKFHRAVRPS